MLLIKIDAINGPIMIKNVLLILSERYPKNGCKSDVEILKVELKIAALATLKSSFAIRRGKTGAKNPGYISVIK